MTRQFVALLLFLLAPVTSAPQRYGRPYTLAENPQLLLEVRVQNKHLYFRGAELRKMHRSVVTQTDPATNASHVYEGVTLEQLVPTTAFALQSENIEIEFGSHQTKSISGIDLDAQTKPMVIDMVDGKQLSGHAPYYFLIKPRGKAVETIANVRCITIKPPG